MWVRRSNEASSSNVPHPHSHCTHCSLFPAEIATQIQPSLYREPFTISMSSSLLSSIQILIGSPTQLSPIFLLPDASVQVDFYKLLQIQPLNCVFIFHLWLYMRAAYHPKQTVIYIVQYFCTVCLNYWVDLIIDSKKCGCLLNKETQWEWKGERNKETEREKLRPRKGQRTKKGRDKNVLREVIL